MEQLTNIFMKGAVSLMKDTNNLRILLNEQSVQDEWDRLYSAENHVIRHPFYDNWDITQYYTFDEVDYTYMDTDADAYDIKFLTYSLLFMEKVVILLAQRIFKKIGLQYNKQYFPITKLHGICYFFNQSYGAYDPMDSLLPVFSTNDFWSYYHINNFIKLDATSLYRKYSNLSLVSDRSKYLAAVRDDFFFSLYDFTDAQIITLCEDLSIPLCNAENDNWDYSSVLSTENNASLIAVKSKKIYQLMHFLDKRKSSLTQDEQKIFSRLLELTQEFPFYMCKDYIFHSDFDGEYAWIQVQGFFNEWVNSPGEFSFNAYFYFLQVYAENAYAYFDQKYHFSDLTSTFMLSVSA